MNRLNYLMRRNRGAKEIDGYKRDLSKIFQIDFSNSDFSDLEESDAIAADFLDAYKLSPKSFHKMYKESEEGDLKKKDQCIA